MKTPALIALASVCLFVSCRHGEAEKLKRKDFSGKVFPVALDSLPVSVTIDPVYGKSGADYLALGSPRNMDGVLSVFSLPEMRHLYSGIRKGRADDEFSAVNWASTPYDDVVSLYDIPKARLRSYRIASDTLYFEREYPLTERVDGADRTMPYVSIVQLDRALFLTRAASFDFDRLSLRDLESGTIEGQVPDLFVRDANRDQYLDYDYVFDYRGDVLVRAYYYLDRIELFSKDADHRFVPLVTISSAPHDERNLNQDDRMVCYQAVVCGDRHFYLLFSGEREGAETQSHLEIFDYRGDSVATIPLGRTLSLISVDERARALYGVDPYNPDYIYRYTLPEFD